MNNTTTIIHDRWGEVEGVRGPRVCIRGQECDGWIRNDVIYLASRGWREKLVELWDENVHAFLPGDIYEYPNFPWAEGDRLKCVERYDMPDRWLQKIKPYIINEPALELWLKDHQKPCLIIEQKVEL